MDRTLDRAMGAAEEYARLMSRGDVVLAEQTERTIDELVGRSVDGVWSWPACVIACARGESSDNLAGMRPARCLHHGWATPAQATVTVAAGAVEYTAKLDGESVRIYRAEPGQWPMIGQGHWDGRAIVDCTADVGDAVGTALSKALSEACR